MPRQIPLFWPATFKDEWLAALSDVFDTRWLGQGPRVDEFEQQFGEKFGYKWCLAVNSGSAALELAYHLAGLQQGDHVLTPVFTCTATNIPLLRRDASIEFVDICNDLTIDYDDVARKLTFDTKALVVVTLGGLPVDPRIYDLAEQRGVPVIVDAAQSLGVAEPRGQYLCYSMQAIKHWTTGDGGMLVLRNEEDYRRAKRLRWFGIDREAKKRADWRCLVNHQMAMDITEPGYKFHMNDIAAAMGIVGLRHSDELLNQRRDLCETYELLCFHRNLDVKPVYGGACWLFAILTDRRDETMEYLRAHGVECDPVQLRNDAFKVFGGRRSDLPNMDRLEDQYLYLPLHPRVTLDDVDYITEMLQQCRAELKSTAAPA
jgi:dTDP-4-amino-4,6-dideoxygalactose transaminase